VVSEGFYLSLGDGEIVELFACGKFEELLAPEEFCVSLSDVEIVEVFEELLAPEEFY
jgi:hypothetical protein